MENICKDIWIFQLFGSTSSVIGRIIREIILTLPRCLYFIYFHIVFISCEVIMINVTSMFYFCKIYIFRDLQKRIKFILCPHTFLILLVIHTFDDCFRSIDYFPIPHNTLCLPPKFCITYCLKMLLGKCNTPRSI